MKNCGAEREHLGPAQPAGSPRGLVGGLGRAGSGGPGGVEVLFWGALIGALGSLFKGPSTTPIGGSRRGIDKPRALQPVNIKGGPESPPRRNLVIPVYPTASPLSSVPSRRPSQIRFHPWRP